VSAQQTLADLLACQGWMRNLFIAGLAPRLWAGLDTVLLHNPLGSWRIAEAISEIGFKCT
jgi:hypothetical protein